MDEVLIYTVEWDIKTCGNTYHERINLYACSVRQAYDIFDRATHHLSPYAFPDICHTFHVKVKLFDPYDDDNTKRILNYRHILYSMRLD